MQPQNSWVAKTAVQNGATDSSMTNCDSMLTTPSLVSLQITGSHLLRPPYGIGQVIIFSCCGFYLLLSSSFFFIA